MNVPTFPALGAMRRARLERVSLQHFMYWYDWWRELRALLARPEHEWVRASYHAWLEQEGWRG